MLVSDFRHIDPPVYASPIIPRNHTPLDLECICEDVDGTVLADCNMVLIKLLHIVYPPFYVLTEPF